jgi:hypothetical protein
MNTIKKSSLVDWQIYQNMEFGYSFSYPKDWALTSENISGPEFVYEFKAPNYNENKLGNYLEVTVSNKPKKEEFTSPFASPIFENIDIAINGKSYKKYNTGSAIPIYSVYILEKNIGLKFNYADYPLHNPNTKIIETIIKSFRF